MSQETLHEVNPEQIADILTDICNAAVSTNSIRPIFIPKKQNVQVYLLTENGNESFPINQAAEKMSNNSHFRKDNELAMIISGWKVDNNNKDNNNPYIKLKEAYKCKGQINLLVIDLSYHIDNIQTWLSIDNEEVGQWIGELITELERNSIFSDISKFHLIGHGIGAHIAGAASRKFTELTGKILPRITALDPSMLCYKETQAITGLQKGDATFVDVIHSSAYGLGKEEPIGDIDFFPNGPSILQPGCKDLVCAHIKSIEYFAETIRPGSEENFLGQKCNSIKNLHSKVCHQEKVPMGIATPKESRGNYFLVTRNSPPYGNNAVANSANNREVNCRTP